MVIGIYNYLIIKLIERKMVGQNLGNFLFCLTWIRKDSMKRKEIFKTVRSSSSHNP